MLSVNMVLNGLMNSFIYWFIKYYIPPMIANASPLLVKGVHRIDFSHVFIDGKPLFGSNKTWEGFFIGVFMGYIASLSIALFSGELFYILVGTGASISALLGDLLGSFIKRRLGIGSGDPFPIVDQLDFALVSSLYYCLLGDELFYLHIDYILYSLFIILLLHIVTNNIAYYIGVKNKRW